MAYEPRRTLLIALTALTVLFAAALFPAAGVGSHPNGSLAGPGGSTPVDTPMTTPELTPTSDEDPGEATTENPETATPTPERTETPTEAVGSGNDGDGLLPELSLWGLFVAFVKVAALLPAVGLVVLLVLAVRGAEPGTPHVHLPFGTITLPFVVPEWVGALSTGVSRLTMGFVVSLSGSVTQLLDASGSALRAVVGGLGIALSEGLRGTASLLVALPSALGTASAGLLALPAGLFSLSWSLPTLGGSITGSTDRPGADARETAPDPVDAETDEDRGPRTVTEAWVTMVDVLPMARSPSTTPREFARQAVDKGFPKRPIALVTRAFEDVVYGGYEPGERVTAARDALASLRDRLGGDA